MADQWRASVVLKHKSGLVEDNAVNTFHFQTVNGPQVDLQVAERIRDMIRDFYTSAVVPAGSPSLAIGQFISQAISRAILSDINVTKRSNPVVITPSGNESWGSPFATYTLTLPAPADSPSLPAECAGVLSFRADYGSLPERGAGGTRPRATRRNRVFIGPLTTGAVSTNDTTGFVSLSMGPWLAAAALRMKQAGDGALDIVQWATYSVKEHDGFRTITGHVDNAPDTQRRRGEKATARTIW